MKKVVFFIPTFRHENRDELTARLKLVVGNANDCQVVQQLGNLPAGSTVVIDSLHRFGDSADRVATAILKVLENGEIQIPNILDLRSSNPQFDYLVQLIRLFANVKRSVKSARIKEALYIKQLSGAVHDSALTPTTKTLIFEEYERCGGIRMTSRNLKAMGITVSASSVSRVIKNGQSHE